MKRQTFDDNGNKLPLNLTPKEKMLESSRYASMCAERAQEQHQNQARREFWRDGFESHMQDYRRFKKQAEGEA